jgi:hypothetical protein
MQQGRKSNRQREETTMNTPKDEQFFCRIIVETPESRFEADHTNPHLIEAAWAAIDAARMLGLQWSSRQYSKRKNEEERK